MATPVKSALAVITLLLSAGAASADEASKKAKIDEIFQITNVDRMVKQITDQMQAMQLAQIAKMDKASQPKAEEAQKKIAQILAERMSWDRLKPRFSKLYEETFTEEELDGTLTFYKSPAGRALLEKMPELMQRSMAVAQEMMADVMPEIESAVRPNQKK
jgi:uncharacterized protein